MSPRPAKHETPHGARRLLRHLSRRRAAQVPGDASRPVALPRELAVATARGLALAWREAPVAAALLTATALLQALIPPLLAAAIGRAVGTLGRSGGSHSIAMIATIIAVLFAAIGTLGPFSDFVELWLSGRVRRRLMSDIVTSALALPGLEHFEDPKSRDMLQLASSATNGPAALVRLSAAMLRTVVSLAGFATLAISAGGWWIPLVVLLATAPEALATGHHLAREAAVQGRHAVDARRLAYTSGLLYSLHAAKEIRLFALKDWLLQKRYDTWVSAMGDVWESRRRGIVVQSLLGIASLSVVAVVNLFLVQRTVAGQLSVAGLTAGTLAVLGVRDQAAALVGNFAFAQRDLAFLPTALRVRDLHRKDPRLSSGRPATRPSASRRHGIRFENVTFAYPRASQPVLRNLTLQIDPGERLGIVGINGAGKTTLIKLLCRFYDPTDGRVLVDGVDLRELNLPAWRERVGVLFQDFVRYPFSLTENVLIGAPARFNDVELLSEAIEAVGLSDRVGSLPSKTSTILRRDFGGADLSGGEWQRVALARLIAGRRAGADVLVLDEPTASLDVRMEHEFYSQFSNLAGDATAILISHRMATMRLATRIVVLNDGALSEQGDHASLLTAGGVYAAMYGAQAAAFKDMNRSTLGSDGS
jgi:ATP-binding cassette subfamily B protein